MKNIKGTIYLSVAALIFLLFSYGANLWLAHVLGPSKYGVYGVVISIMALLNLMQTTGLPQTISRTVAFGKIPEEVILNIGYKLQITTTGLLTLFFILISYPLSVLLNDRQLFPYLIASAAILPFYGIYALYSGYLNGLHKFSQQAFINIIYSTSKLILIIVLAKKWGLAGAIAAFILAPILPIVFAKVPYPKAEIGQYSYLYKKLFKESLPFVGIAFIIMAFQSFDLLFIKGIVKDNAVAGYYTVAQSIALIPFLGFAAIGQVIFPNISSLIGSGGNLHVRKMISQSFRYLILLVFPLVCLMIATASRLIQLLYGSAYLPATRPLQLLLIAYMFLSIFSLMINILNGAQQTKSSIFISITGLTITVCACPILIVEIGASGAALATLAGTFLLAVLSILKTHQVFKYHVYAKSIFRTLIASFFITITSIVIRVPIYLLPILYIAMGAIYLSILWTTGELSEEDRGYLNKILPFWDIT
jgi:stage V sporulation protein B